jgi:hypothetical protein
MKSGILYLSLLIVAISVIGFQTGAYYEFQKRFLWNPVTSDTSGNHGGPGSNGSNSSSNSGSNGNRSNSHYIDVNTIINYGNTSTWFNNTEVTEGWNFYNLTLLLANGNVDSQFYPGFNEHYVLGINGVEEKLPYYWSLWIFCSKDNAWALSAVGADDIRLSNDGIYGWYYQQTGTVPPVVGANTVVICST